MSRAADEIGILAARRRLEATCADVTRGATKLEHAYADLAEALLVGAGKLAAEAAAADFTPPPYPARRHEEIELTLSQTREMKLRLGGHREEHR